MNRNRITSPRPPKRLLNQVARIGKGDQWFFGEHPSRHHRLRHAHEAELRLHVLRGGDLEPAGEGEAHFIAVRRDHRDKLSHVFLRADATLPIDVSERMAADLYLMAGGGPLPLRPTASIVAFPVSPDEYEAVVEGDRRFFDRHRQRSHRMRLTARAEMMMAARGGMPMQPPGCGFRWVSVIRSLGSDTRHKLTCQLPETADLDAPEEACAKLFAYLANEPSDLNGEILAGNIFFADAPRGDAA